MTSNELTAYRAEDSMTMVAIVLYNPPSPVEDPVAARTFLPRRMSPTAIIMVRRTLSESDIENHARFHGRRLTTRSDGKSARMPIAILPTSALSITTVRGELKYIPAEPRNMREGKAMTQRFLA